MSPRVVRKVVGYVVREDKLLVFTHDDIPLEVTGVQVPAGTIEVDETPKDAVLREVLEETGLDTRIVSELGMECYDARPTKPEIHERYFFQLAPIERQVPERWSPGKKIHPMAVSRSGGLVSGCLWNNHKYCAQDSVQDWES